MSFALNEIEAISKKAARGAGMAWGIAEEAGKTARWLASHGLPGPELLLDLLELNDGRDYEEIAPLTTKGSWVSRAGRICPLIAGAAISDCSAVLSTKRAFELGSTSFPLLLVPYMENCAKDIGMPVELSWPGVVLSVSPQGGFWVDGDNQAVLVDVAPFVHCKVSKVGDRPWSFSKPVRPMIDASIWERLENFAHRTYAPATEESRKLGAGSDRIDDE